MTRSDTAEFLQRDPTVVSRYETGEYPIRRADVYALLTFYGVEDEGSREVLLALCEDVWRKSWWDPYSEDVTRDFINLPWLESRADRIFEYQNMLMPGLLQTSGYAEAVIRHAEDGAAEEQIDRWVELRLARQKVLEAKAPVRHTVILEEPVLRRPMSGQKVMREQLEHLLEVSQRDHIDVRVMPTAFGPHKGHLGSFTIFEMPEEFPSVAYVETLGGSLYIESPGIERFEAAWEDLDRNALNTQRSAAFIRSVLKETK